MNHSDLKLKFFKRHWSDTSRWDATVARPGNEDTGKYGELFHDVFTGHTEIGLSERDRDTLHLQMEDAKRIIRLDNLTPYFQYKFIRPDLAVEERELFRLAPVFESGNLEATPEELGDPVDIERIFKLCTDSPFTPHNVKDHSLGQNRLTYLIGEVGQGKSFLSSIIAAKLCGYRDQHNYSVIPVHACLEDFLAQNPGVTDDEGDVGSREFVRLFMRYCYDASLEAARRAKKSREYFQQEKIEVDSTAEEIGAAFRSLCIDLLNNGDNSYRIFLIVDNLDILHYQGSRWIFFPESYDRHRKDVETKLSGIVSSFAFRERFGNCGLCVLVNARRNVAMDGRSLTKQGRPSVFQFEDHTTFQLGQLSPDQIINSRLHLMQEVMQRLESSGHSLSYLEQLAALRANLAMRGGRVC